MVNNMSQDSTARPEPSVVETLRAERDHAQENLDRFTAEYEEILHNPDVIQEDRDAAGRRVAQARESLQRAETALTRAESGQYGRCVKCGAEIPTERLEALPGTDTCVACS